MTSDIPSNAPEYGVIPPYLAIDSMRRNGYLTTDNAIAELIDNSIEAGARNVDVLLFEKEVQLKVNKVTRIVEIGVLDDGEGMDHKTLRSALVFGGGDRQARGGMGRFGFGLPNSSISQASKVHVWSWQNGAANSLGTYLDVSEIRDQLYQTVPPPGQGQPPAILTELVGDLGRTGTYISWSDLDPDITWKRGRTVIQHTARLVGRIYRYFLRRETDPVRIRMIVVAPDGTIDHESEIVPNDPLYLMEATSCPWEDEPMFQPHGQPESFTFEDKEGENRSVRVTISYSKPDCRLARGGVAAGALEHGKHALYNQGVSIVRAMRELQLDNCITVNRFLDRWWSVEIAFSPQLDELFGVSNNKQAASILVAALKAFDADSHLTVEQLIERGDLDRGEDRVDLYRMAQWVVEQVRTVMILIRKQNEGERGDGQQRHGDSTVEDRATDAIKKRAGAHPTEDEEEEREHPTTPEEQLKAGVQSLIEKGVPAEEAKAIMEVALDRDRKVLFVESGPHDDGDHIFSIKTIPGARVEVTFNVNHPAHSQVFEALDDTTDGLTEAELAGRIEVASSALKILFAAWTRMELEARVGPERTNISRVRRDWGRMAADFLDPDLSRVDDEPGAG